MIEISFGKLLVLALIALVVLGPEKLPAAARTAGALLRRVRGSWDSVRAEVERELQVEEIRRTARDAVARVDAAQAELDTTLQQVREVAQGPATLLTGSQSVGEGAVSQDATALPTAGAALAGPPAGPEAADVADATDFVLSAPAPDAATGRDRDESAAVVAGDAQQELATDLPEADTRTGDLFAVDAATAEPTDGRPGTAQESTRGRA